MYRGWRGGRKDDCAAARPLRLLLVGVTIAGRSGGSSSSAERTKHTHRHNADVSETLTQATRSQPRALLCVLLTCPILVC